MDGWGRSWIGRPPDYHRHREQGQFHEDTERQREVEQQRRRLGKIERGNGEEDK